MELEDLVGRKKLDAVSFSDASGRFGDADFIKFRLDGVVYCATEDEEDGYRSSYGELSSCEELIILDHDDIDNVFPPVGVDCVVRDSEDECILTLYDAITFEVVLNVGTCYIDAYHPYFVAQFFPEAMCINRGAL